ncbi:PREDICTED: calcium-binding protein P-like [Ipomoea nil]|uniref:calcium-binding protein P-like n=1 Tax=Ipomoea nil TaxID=35883 RepID=UPI000901BFA2|nr:PREDICTED: calcium-binding protein P-like [Ipomoea nil]
MYLWAQELVRDDQADEASSSDHPSSHQQGHAADLNLNLSPPHQSTSYPAAQQPVNYIQPGYYVPEQPGQPDQQFQHPQFQQYPQYPGHYPYPVPPQPYGYWPGQPMYYTPPVGYPPYTPAFTAPAAAPPLYPTASALFPG